ncbi:MAG: hypothetical protein OXE42_01290 [Gammaproteobacteria bacterium]|nr:hypothetical protein [Gammaproteobacteria bacterium]
MKHSFEIEIRQAAEGGELHGVMLTEGRAASGGRAELFAPGSVQWPSEGVEIAPGHKLPSETRAHPVRQRDGSLTLRTRATDALRAAVQAGRRFMSVEFHALEERTTAGGVREILKAYAVRAALVPNPEYDVTAAEIRSKRGRRVWL